MFELLFINKGRKKSEDRNTVKFASFRKFYVVAEVASFVGNPVVELFFEREVVRVQELIENYNFPFL